MSDEIRDLLQWEDYDRDETGYWGRVPYAFGLLWSVGMALFAFFEPWELRYSVPTRIVLCLFFGLPTGFAFRYFFRRTFRRNLSTMYRNGNSVDGLDGPARYRLLCTRVLDSRLLISGNIYVTDKSLHFIPNQKIKDQQPETIQLSPLGSLTAVILPPVELTRMQRLLIPNSLPLIGVRSPETSAKFVVPQANKVKELLTQIFVA